ncbi:hypothetical protein D3C73_1578240 [compost metagenome]
MKKAANEWYNCVVTPTGATSPEDRAFGMEMYKMFRNADLNYDIEDQTGSEPTPATSSEQELKDAEF